MPLTISTHAAHEGAAHRHLSLSVRLRHISTHAAHEGAADDGGREATRRGHFNSRGPRRGRERRHRIDTVMVEFQLTRPTKGPRPAAKRTQSASTISTHAAHEGAASPRQSKYYRHGHFNSRGPRRGREGGHQGCRGRLVFQLTRPTKGPRAAPWGWSPSAGISTHAAHEGAALARHRLTSQCFHFNSRGPRRGRAETVA